MFVIKKTNKVQFFAKVTFGMEMNKGENKAVKIKVRKIIPRYFSMKFLFHNQDQEKK